MNVRMQKGRNPAHLAYHNWSLGVLGSALDARGKAATEFVRANCAAVIQVEYAEDDYQLMIDGRVMDAEEISGDLQNLAGGRVVLEATTLGFVEIFLCCRALQKLGLHSLDMTYVEPAEYTRPLRSQPLHRRDFALSDEVPGFRAIPSAAFIIDDRRPQKAVFFLGYEERRLDRALEDFPLRPSMCAVVFGVPAFQPGWEMDAFANNIKVIRHKGVEGGVHFCGAENPSAAVDILSRVYEERVQDERLFVAPIGTKPHGIGAALFAAAHPDVGILYDHPRRKTGRSSDTASWHLFAVTF